MLIFRKASILIFLLAWISNSHVAFTQNKKTASPDVPLELEPSIATLQPGVRLTLLAEHPELVTPTGIDIDVQGQIWLTACHTHFRPDEYTGPIHDEILVFDKDGKNRRVFYNRTDATMHVELGRDGWVYLAERDRILRVKDTDGDGIGDLEETLATLDTTADYPHNGLSGMAWHPDGGLVFSLGENYAKDWTLTARDGTSVTGSGEGGIFRCSTEGAQMRRIARGFWNPFGLLVRDDGEIFAAENDPGSRPPCRLLNIIEGADYGYQRAYGNASVHPFVGWNGELRGTIGMIHPSGEGPCAVVELGGGVVIPSWSNHSIDYYPLIRQGAGYTSSKISLIQGSDFFRPVCMVAGPEETFYLTDWVFSSYQLHARGRLWKLEIDKQQATWLKPTREPLNEAARLANSLRDGSSKAKQSQLFDYARGSDPYLADAALTALARESQAWTPETLLAFNSKDRIWALVALRRIDLKEEKWVRAMLDIPEPELQFECLRWIADGVLSSFHDEVDKILSQPKLDYRLFEAALATWNTLNGMPEAGVTDPKLLVDRILSPQTPVRSKSFALRLTPPDEKRLTIAYLRELLLLDDAFLTLEVVRTLAAKNSIEAWDILADIAENETQGIETRAEAVTGLANSTKDDHLKLLLKLAREENRAIRHEALRGLRSRKIDDTAKPSLREIAVKFPQSASLVDAILDPTSIHRGRPTLDQTEAWLERMGQLPFDADPDEGRRIFFHSKVASCSLCHRHDGRGNVVGPDLSFVAQQSDRKKLLQAILEPNRDVAPQYFTTLLELDDGTTFSGMLLRSSSKDVFRDNQGRERSFDPSEVVGRKELKTSMMPTGLIEQVTDSELRDLLAFLETTSYETHTQDYWDQNRRRSSQR